MVLFGRTISWASAFLISLISVGSAAADWPSYRGPRGDGTAEAADLPVKWDAETGGENVIWKVPVPGKGHSSPIVVGDRIFLTTCVEKDGRRLTICLDRTTGKTLWEREAFTAPVERIHRENSHASATPVSDGKHVWVSFLKLPEMINICYDLDGKEIWRMSPGRFFSKHGFGCSPILYKDLVIFNGDQDKPSEDFKTFSSQGVTGEGYLVALDKLTGKEVWRINRTFNNRITRSYCVPIIVEAAGKTQMILSGNWTVASYDPATGKQHWIVDGPTQQFVSSPILVDGVVFMTYGFPKRGIIGIKPDGEGNVTKTHVLWNIEKQSRGGYVPSPVAAGKLVFVVNDEGIATCVDPHTGKEYWLERLATHYHASPIAVNGNIYFFSDDGKAHVVKASEKFELVSQFPLGDECYSSPAVSHGRLYIRTLHHMFCVGKK